MTVSRDDAARSGNMQYDAAGAGAPHAANAPIRPAPFELRRFATAFPDATLNRELAASIAALLQDALLEMLDNCAESLQLDLARVRAWVAALDPSARPSPALYSIATHLQIAMANNDADMVYDWLSRLLRLADHPAAPSAPISSILTEEWEHPSVEAMRRYDQTNIRGEATIVWPLLDEARMAAHRDHIATALALLRQFDPDCFDEYQVFVACIKLFQGQVLRGETSKMSYGAIWLREPEPEVDQVAYWIEHIVHEISHLRLEAVFMHEQLVLNPASEKVFRAPIRDDPRPMRGVFHACFVLARIIRVFRRMSLAGYDKRLRDQLRLFELQFEIGHASVHDPAARLSDNGINIRASLAPCCVS